MPNRRHFLRQSIGIAALTGRSPFSRSLTTDQADYIRSLTPPPLPDSALYDTNEEAYWAEVRRQFIIPTDEIYINNGTVGSSPSPELKAIFDSNVSCERLDQTDPTESNNFASMDRT